MKSLTATLFALAALPALSLAQGPEKPCTTTFGYNPGCHCGQTSHTVTSTAFTDCHGCSVATSRPIAVCEIQCPAQTTIAPGTTTVKTVLCSPTP